MKKCKCKEWKKNIDLVDASLDLAYLHGEIRRIVSFRFCPYCGKKLKEEK